MTITGMAGSRPGGATVRPTSSSEERAATPLRAHSETGLQPQASDRAPRNPWTDAQVIRPEALVKLLSAAQKPILLHIGVEGLFRRGHIPGSTFIGRGATAEGIDALKKAVQGLGRDRGIVLYCGCCPWNDCPNIRPAFEVLQLLRYTNVQVLYLPKNFSEDWGDKGFPVAKGGIPAGAGN